MSELGRRCAAARNCRIDCHCGAPSAAGEAGGALPSGCCSALIEFRSLNFPAGLGVPPPLVAARDGRDGDRQGDGTGRDAGERQALNALRWAVHGSAEGAGAIALDMHDKRQARSRHDFENTAPIPGDFLRRRRSGEHCRQERSRQAKGIPLQETGDV